jgi:hypothetical protein
MDQVLADSFPASDPPSWNLGIARAGPASHPAHHLNTDGRVGRRAPVASAPSRHVSDARDARRPSSLGGLHSATVTSE